jgi:Tfp pilus assembly protein PilN
MSAILVLVSGVFVIGTVLLIPSFVAAISSREAGKVRLETTRRLLDRQKDATAASDVVSTKEKVSLVIRDNDALSASDILARVVEIVPSQVSLQSVLWSDEGETAFLDMTGSAATRNSLIAFGDALRSSGLFTEVTIPIESLAQQTDLHFRLSLTLAP